MTDTVRVVPFDFALRQQGVLASTQNCEYGNSFEVIERVCGTDTVYRLLHRERLQVPKKQRKWQSLTVGPRRNACYRLKLM